MRLARPDRSGIEDLGNLKLPDASGGQIALQRSTEPSTRRRSITSVYRKNLQPVVYVTGDVAGGEESPVYAIMKMSEAIDKIKLPDGYDVKQYKGTTMPERTDRFSMKWDGEWHITVEVFRDLGLAFAAVLVLIYVLVVGWFRSFITPLVIMAPIPLTLVGILPAHALMGAFFTATSMIGFIAGAGIIVRNSIILVDFIELRRSQGMSLEEAVVDAGAVRFRPMLLTAAAVVVGASVILFDPDFPGLGYFVDGGRSRVDGALANGGAGSLLLERTRWKARGAVPERLSILCTCRGLKRRKYERRTVPSVGRRRDCGGVAGLGILGERVLVPVDCVCRLEPVPVGIFELVPDDDLSAQSGSEGIG